MSVKHVKEYYEQMTADYSEMIENLHELEEEASKGLVSPEKVDKMKELVKPIKENYMRVSWIMFLLNQPNKTEKKKKYQKQNAKSIDELKDCTQTALHTENEEYMERMKKSFD